MSDALAELDARVNALLPPRYQHCLSDVRPDSMGSAGVRYDTDGRPAWDRIWTTFCDLALAGGPPHRGRWLQWPTAAEMAADLAAQAAVAAEVARGVRLTTHLPASPLADGRVAVGLPTREAAAWLRAAVVAENVAADRDGCRLLLPAGPDYRVEKEVKNVVVAVAKTAHYWDGHLTDDQQRAAVGLLDPLAPADPPADPAAVADAVRAACGWAVDAGHEPAWVGVACPDDAAVVWLLRAVVAGGMLARREGTTLCLPVPDFEAAARRVGDVFTHSYRLWAACGPPGTRQS